MSSDGGRREFIRQYIRVSGLSDRSTRPSIERFDIAGLSLAIILGAIFAFFDGVISYIIAIGRGLTQMLGGVSSSLATLIELALGIDQAFEASVWSATFQLTTTGIAAWVIGIAVVALTIYVLSLGVSLVE